MIPDLSPIFARYEALVAEADTIFAHVRQSHSQCVACTQGCSDCCHALFDLSLVEAMYLNKAFEASVPYGKERSDILMRAADIDRQAVRMKRDFYRASKDGKDAEDIMLQAAHMRLPCPLLDANASCQLYEHRPITCRLYGIPLNINGKGHVCGQTGFTGGGSYPTVNMAAIQNRLDGLSRDIVQAVNSRFTKLDEVFVPVSMALLTRYDEQYLGIGPAKKE